VIALVVIVLAQWSGAAPSEMEREVTVPLERALAGMPELRAVTSATFTGVTRLELQVDAPAEVRSRIDRAILPKGATTGVWPIVERPIFRYTVESDRYTATELPVAPALHGSPIAAIETCGQPEPRLRVTLDPARAAAMHVQLADVKAALRVDPRAPLRAFDDLRQLLVGRRNGVPLFLRDVANVEMGAAPPRCRAFRDGRPAIAAAAHLAYGTTDEALGWLTGRLPFAVQLRPLGEPVWRARLFGAAEASEIERQLRRTPEVASVLLLTETPDETDAFVSLRPGRDEAVLQRELSAHLAELPVGQLFHSAGALEVRVSGPDATELDRLAAAAAKILQVIPGARGVGLRGAGEQPRLDAQLDRAAIARYDLDDTEVLDTIEAARGGLVVGELRPGDRRLPIVVRFLPAANEAAALAAARVLGRDGGVVPLSSLARIALTADRKLILRADGARYVSVVLTADDAPRFRAAARAKLAAELPLPLGYRLELAPPRD
jgi:multidrug efflux pump subunit AcrB